MKWDIIIVTWEYRIPKFWSKCNFLHYHKGYIYEPYDKNKICETCHIWWTTDIKRYERYYPSQFNKEGKMNEPFWYVEGEAGIKKNPLYTTEYGWLNGRGIALQREIIFRNNL